jgi:hypothetical protein
VGRVGNGAGLGLNRRLRESGSLEQGDCCRRRASVLREGAFGERVGWIKPLRFMQAPRGAAHEGSASDGHGLWSRRYPEHGACAAGRQTPSAPVSTEPLPPQNTANEPPGGLRSCVLRVCFCSAFFSLRRSFEVIVRGARATALCLCYLWSYRHKSFSHSHPKIPRDVIYSMLDAQHPSLLATATGNCRATSKASAQTQSWL